MKIMGKLLAELGPAQSLRPAVAEVWSLGGSEE